MCQPPVRLVLPLLLIASIGLGCKPEPAATTPATVAAAKSASPPATEPATKPAIARYFDVLRSAYPTFAATQPLDAPLSIRESAHIVLKELVHLDEQGHLWITRHDGIDAETETRDATKMVDSEHVVRERVLFAWWVPDRGQNYMPRVITRAADGSTEMVVPSRRWSLGNRPDYRWDRARSWVDGQNYRLIVPTVHGVSIFTYQSDREPIPEAHQDLLQLTAASTAPAGVSPQAKSPNPAEPPLFLFDPVGVIAWIPATPTTAGSGGAARFARGRWQILSSDTGWTDRTLHLIPLRDGSVTQLLQKPRDVGGGVTLALTSVDAPQVDRKVIENLVDSLSDVDKDIRDAAYLQLTEYGAGIWPMLREIPADDLPPEARSRLNRLLRSQATPMLGGMALQGDQLKLVSRLRDGGVVFHTEQGINVPNPAADDPISHAPAWIAARPGRAVQMLSGALVYDADPGRTKFDVIQGHWVVTFNDEGPQLFLGNSFRKLLRKDVREYSHVVGIDRRGRWVFRKPADADRVADGDVETLIIDPTLADFTPRLPVWLFANANEAGWTADGWPVVRSGESRTKLLADQWANLGDAEAFLTEPDAAPVAAELKPWWPTATTSPATTPTTSTAPAAQAAIPRHRLAELGRVLLTDADGNRYFGGIDDLVRVDRHGVESRWPLPPDADGDPVGEAPPLLIHAGENRLFLFNRRGKVHRIKAADVDPPFVLEATFTQNIPDDERPARIWLDPAGRIIMAYDQRIAILFPQGYIPTAIRRMMDMDDEE